MSSDITWAANTEADIAGYKVHYGTLSGNYGTHADVGTKITHTPSNLTSGVTYYITVTAYDSSGMKVLFLLR
ncbi:MAG: fibronectin type III domain-containing protein [Candidatus Scalindua sp.]|nr:fibronectin type III domain-containing protein [Candidatus Scalindua sp.]